MARCNSTLTGAERDGRTRDCEKRSSVLRGDHSAGAAPDRASTRCCALAARPLPESAREELREAPNRVHAKYSPAAMINRNRIFFICHPRRAEVPSPPWCTLILARESAGRQEMAGALRVAFGGIDGNNVPMADDPRPDSQ